MTYTPEQLRLEADDLEIDSAGKIKVEVNREGVINRLRAHAAALETIRERDAVIADEREQFARETLRTSEQAVLLRKWVERHKVDHAPGPWSRGCDTCALVGKTEALLAAPINQANPLAERDAEIARLKGHCEAFANCRMDI